MTATFYSTSADVIARTGVSPEDLGLTTTPELTAFMEGLLAEVTDILDREMRQSYLAAATVPAGLNGIAADAASDSLRTMIATRQTPVVRIDDFAVRVIQSRILSPDIKERLKLYSTGRGVASVDMGSDISTAPFRADYDTSVFLLQPDQQ